MITTKFIVSLNETPLEDCFCKYSLVDGSAISFLNGVPNRNIIDYVSTNGFVLFKSGNKDAEVSIEINENVKSNFSKTFYMILYDPHNCDIDRTPYKCTINYDDSSNISTEITPFYDLNNSSKLTVEELDDFFSYVSFSSPENCRWSDTNNIINRDSDWITEPYYSYYEKKGLKYQRLCNSYETLMDQPYGDIVPSRGIMQRKSIIWANKHGIKTITSNHNDTQWCLDGSVAMMGDGIFTIQSFKDLISKQTKLFQDLDGYIGIQLNCEPANPDSSYGITLGTWGTFGVEGYNSVREINDQIYILLDGNGGAAIPTGFEEKNVWFQNLVDPQNRLFIVSDIYLDTYAGGGQPYMDDIQKEGDGYRYNTDIDSSTGERRVNWVLPWIKKYGKKLLIGETGGGQQDSNNTLSSSKWGSVVQGMTKTCYNNKIPLGIWCSGPDFNTFYSDMVGTYENRYPLSLDPYGSTLRYGIYEFGTISPVLTQFSRYFGPEDNLTWKLLPQFDVTSSSVSIDISCNFSNQYPFEVKVNDSSGGSTSNNGVIEFNGNYPTQNSNVIYTPVKGNQFTIINLDSNINVPTLPDSTTIVFDIDMFSQLEITPEIVIWPLKIVSNYDGPCFNLTKSDGSDSTDFNFVGGTSKYGIGAGVDNISISKFDTNPLVKTYYDQSGNQNNMGIYLGETSEWKNKNGDVNPPSTYSDYPRYMKARDIDIYIPHFGGDFGDYDINNRLNNRMDIKHDINGSMNFTIFFVVGITNEIGIGDYLISYIYKNRNLISGPNGQTTIEASESITVNEYPDLNKFNFYSYEYNGGNLIQSSDGNTTANSDYTIFTFTDTENSYIFDSNTLKVTVNSNNISNVYDFKKYPGNIDNSIMRFVFEIEDKNYVLLTPYVGSSTMKIYDKNGYFRIYKNNILVSDTKIYGPIINQYNDYMNIGWDRYYESVTACDIIGLIKINDNITDYQRTLMYKSLISSLGIQP